MLIFLENVQDKIELTEEIEKLIKIAIELSLEKENFKIHSEISVTLMDDEGIRKVNKEYRNIDSPTDVLSFPLVEMHEGKIISNVGDYDLDEGAIILGDILISLERVQKQANEYQHSFERELAFLVTHGVYHLLGYDHQDEESEKLMIGKQKEVLKEMGLDRVEI
ncbi:MAG TPA: rRNA maturation RNase YbeY [Clostridiaceae bacterium]|nr:rRNA maturation RNase YbeY [Clostridiaceae bacterium]